jgi:signal transduction histidine kinase/ActR/RegA family two-component response regulator
MLSRNALRQLMAHAAGAGSLQSVYQTALRGVQEALNVERASLLAFDATRTMRFVAWSGLSDTYRAAVDGHSPWPADESSALPILVPDIEEDASLAGLREAFRREDIRGLAFVPIQFGTRLLGKFMLYYRERHTFADREVPIAQQIADYVAFALEHHRLAVALDSRLTVERELRQRAETETALHEALGKASDQIAESLDPDEAFRQLATCVVPVFADYCITYAAAGAAIRRVGAAHRDLTKRSMVEALADCIPITIEDLEGPGKAIRLGEPCVLTDLDPGFATRQAGPLAPDDVRLLLEPRSLMTVPLKARGRTLGAIVFAATDDSARRFGASELRMAMELASRAALLVDNARLYADARTAIRSRDDMAAFISHDLRDPLQSISAATATLRLEPQTADSAESIESIAHASTQMRRLVQDLLDVSMIEAGRLPVHHELVDLRDLVVESQTLVLPRVKAQRVRIETRLPEGLPPVLIDRHRILQVLLNLIGNALKFGAEGGALTLGAEEHEGTIRVWIQDRGSGISPEHLPRVFDRFWRADRRGGAGLGLAVAKGIVEAHGGRIGVTSEVAVGSTFFFSLPIHAGTDRAASGDGRQKNGPRDRQPRRRVLLVDDDPDVVRSLVRLVRSLGHEVHVAFSGEEALLVAEQVQPQMILMDISLPGLSGYDTARDIRTRPWGRGVTLVAVTGWGRDEDQRRAVDAGFDRHLTKPVDADVLEALLNDAPVAQPASGVSGIAYDGPTSFERC